MQQTSNFKQLESLEIATTNTFSKTETFAKNADVFSENS